MQVTREGGRRLALIDYYCYYWYYYYWYYYCWYYYYWNYYY